MQRLAELPEVPVRLRLGPLKKAAEQGNNDHPRYRASSRRDLRPDLGRPPPPAAPMSGPRDDRPCHFKVAGQNRCLHMWSGHQRRYAVQKLDTNVKNLATKDR